MNQNIWGSSMWFTLHTITMNYPDLPNNQDKYNYKNLFESLQTVIPCVVCKKNYIRHLKEHPIDNHLNSKKKLVYWLIDMHNMVNAEIGKKQMSYNTVIQKYEDIYSKKIFSEGIIERFKNKQEYNYFKILIIICVIFLIFFIYYFIFNFNIKKK